MPTDFVAAPAYLCAVFSVTLIVMEAAARYLRYLLGGIADVSD